MPGRQSVILTFERMRRIREIDPVGNSMTMEAGCSLQEAREAAELAGRLLGIDHGGRSSHIGGNLSTNAGGNNVLRYGMAREQVLGLEVVLANGEILSELSPLPKNNSGYDLKQLFIGSEGTLGLITAACLKLRQKSARRVTACVGLDSLGDVMSLFALAREVLADSISAFELMPRAGLDFHFAHIGERHEPFDTITPWIILLEAESASSHFELDPAVASLLEEALRRGLVRDGTIAASDSQRARLWALREGIPIAMIENPHSLKSDTAVPISAIPVFVERAYAAVTAAMPGCIAIPFGHVGDGNIHLNVLPPPSMAYADFVQRKSELARLINAVTLSLNGTVSAEHGIGLLKRSSLAEMKSYPALVTMQAIKTALDPLEILNPRKIF